ncbi:MAG: histidinol-phosphatase [Oligosphaeraceae bacterium]
MGHCNFHTHTYHCRHATGTPGDYCREALAQGISTLGFSDHAPWPDGKWKEVRMPQDELDAYFREIQEARQEFPRLEIHAGLECEYRPDLGSYTHDAFLDTPGRCEYLVLAIHDYRDPRGEWCSSWHLHDTRQYLDYARYAVQAMESGLFAFLAHPDLFLVARGAWDDNAREAARLIAQAAQDTRTPLELNAAGLRRPFVVDDSGLKRRPFPYIGFWEIAAQYQIQAVVSSDAHTPQDVWGNAGETLAMARYFGIPLATPETLFPPPAP